MGRASVRAYTGCRDCVKCTNSGVAYAARNAGRAGVGIMTLGMSEAAMAFTPNCRACGHKLSLHGHDREAERAAVHNPAHSDVVAGWYPDPSGAPVLRWWSGYSWTNDTSPLAESTSPVTVGTPIVPTGPDAGWYSDPDGTPNLRWWNGSEWTEHRK